MSNKLKKVFDNKKIVPKVMLNFKDEKAEQVFLDKMNKGESFDASQIVDVFSYYERGDEKYPHSMSGDNKLFIYPEKKNNENIVQYNYKGKTRNIVFVKEKYLVNDEEKESVRNKNNDIVEIRMVFDENRISINNRVHLQKASCIKDIYTSFESIYGFLLSLNDKGESGEDFKKMLKYFRINTAYYKRVLELEKKLNIQFKPSSIKNIPEEVEMVERLYFWLVKNRVIRTNEKLGDISKNEPVSDPEFEVGKTVNFLGESELAGEIYGVKVKVYILESYLNAVISKKEVLGSETILHFEEKDSSPTINAVKGFLNKEDMVRERNNFKKHADDYLNAQYLGELSIEELELGQ